MLTIVLRMIRFLHNTHVADALTTKSSFSIMGRDVSVVAITRISEKKIINQLG